MNAAEIVFMEFNRYIVTLNITKCIAFEDNHFFFACISNATCFGPSRGSSSGIKIKKKTYVKHKHV